MKYIIGHTDRLGRTFYRAIEGTQFVWQPFEDRASQYTDPLSILTNGEFLQGLEPKEMVFIKRVE